MQGLANIANLGNLGSLGDAGSGYNFVPDSAYKAVLDRAITLGYTLPSQYCRFIQNRMLLALKAAGIWDKLDAFWVPANDGSSNFATLNWKSPSTSQMTLVNSPQWITREGFKGNGSTSYVNTNFTSTTQGVNYVLDNACRFTWVTTIPTIGTAFEGGTATPASVGNIMAYSTTAVKKINSTNDLSSGFSTTTGAGLKSIHRTSSINVTLANGSVSDTRTATSTALSGSPFVVGRGASSLYSNTTVGIYGVGASLVSELTSLNSTLTAYMNDLV